MNINRILHRFRPSNFLTRCMPEAGVGHRLAKMAVHAKLKSVRVCESEDQGTFKSPWTTTQAEGAYVYLILSCSGGGIDRLGLGIESLALCCLSAHRAEAFDAQLLPSLDSCSGPGGDVLVGLLAGSILLLGHNLVSLVDHQIGFLVPRCSLLFVALEDHDLCQFSPGNLSHCLLLHCLHALHRGGLFHCLHALHHGLLHRKGHVESNRKRSLRWVAECKLQASWSHFNWKQSSTESTVNDINQNVNLETAINLQMSECTSRTPPVPSAQDCIVRKSFNQNVPARNGQKDLYMHTCTQRL